MDTTAFRKRMVEALFAPHNARVVGMTRANTGAGFSATLEQSKARAGHLAEKLYAQPTEQASAEQDCAVDGT